MLCIIQYIYLGWHQADPHKFLLKHGNQIIPSFETDDTTCQSEDSPSNEFRIFVPLCGKTVDMAFLANHASISQVVGIDGIRKALTAFAEENPNLEIQTTETTPADNANDVVERFHGKNIELLRGDLFDLDDEVTNGKFDMILDRASIVAIQPNLRQKYVETMGKLVKPGGKVLLVTLDRRTGTDESRKAGPPFSVDEKEVRRLYENCEWVEEVTLVDEYDEFQDEGTKARMGSQGLESLFELCFIVKAKK